MALRAVADQEAATTAADDGLPPGSAEPGQSQLRQRIARGKEQGFLTYAEVNDHLPSEIVDPEQIEDIVQMFNDMGIPVYEKAPDAESLPPREPVVADEEATEEAAAALARLREDLEIQQVELADIERRMHLTIAEIKEINREIAVGAARATAAACCRSDDYAG